MKSRGLIIFVIILLVICVILLSGILFLSLNNNIKGFKNVFKRYHISTTKILEKDYERKFNNIDIDTAAADIEIKKGDSYKVVVYGEDELLTFNDENELSIKYDSKPCYFFCFTSVTSAKIEVYLKEDYDGEIKINNDFGDVKVSEFKNSKVTIESAFGDSSIEGCETIDISSSCGDIKIGEVGNATIKNNYGDIDVIKITNKANIKADCGDIEIKEVDLKENSYIENNFGDIRIKKTNDIYIDSKVSLGDNRVNNNNHKSDITLNITNDCGDIKVN